MCTDVYIVFMWWDQDWLLFFFPCGVVTVPVPGICCATFVMYIFSNMLGSLLGSLLWSLVCLSLSLQLLQIFIYCCFICSVFFGSKNFLSLYFFLPHEIFEVYFSPKCGRFCELSFCYWFLTCTVVSKWGLYATRLFEIWELLCGLLVSFSTAPWMTEETMYSQTFGAR